MKREQLLEKLDKAWTEFKKSYAGLTEAQLTEPGVTEEWSVKEVLAHLTTWEEEALKYLPLILEGGSPPRYAATGGLDAFNARTIARKRVLPLSEILVQLDTTHQQLVDYLKSVPEEPFTTETRFRHRLRLDTYSHYPLHTKMIRDWRKQQQTGFNPSITAQ